jgi:hypothetical protein
MSISIYKIAISVSVCGGCVGNQLCISNAACQKVAVALALFESCGLTLVVYHSNVCFLFWGGDDIDKCLYNRGSMQILIKS